MICSYGLSLCGTSHTAVGIVCQDAHKIKELSNGWITAAIADGVGSSKYSDIAAKIAVDTVIDTIEKGFYSSDEKSYIIKLGFITALHNIRCTARIRGDNIRDYDTTLTVLIYDGKHISYGHVGDGGIIGLTLSGEYISVTRVQKGDEHNIVVPLRVGLSGWKFGVCNDEFCSLTMLTDGLLDIAMPSLLNGGVYVRFIRQFMDNAILDIDRSNTEKIKLQVESFLKSDVCKPITDDKTMVTIINNNLYAGIKDSAYYNEPDWEKLREEKYRLLYN